MMPKRTAPNTRLILIALLACLAILKIMPGTSLPAVAAAPAMFIGCDTPVFSSVTNFGAGNTPRSVAIGDFNLDNKLDLATANINGGNVSVLLGNGNGGFGAATNFGVDSGPISIATGDFNRDGKPDLATANLGANTVSVLLGNGMGGFGAATNFGVGTFPFSIAVGDFNLDNNPDLVTANTLSTNVSVLLGNGMGGFGAATSFGTGNLPRSVKVGDVNRDDKPDLVVANQGTNDLSILIGNGMGGFTAIPGPGTAESPVSVAIGDLNGDDNPDLAVANADAKSISVLLGNGMGGFAPKTDFLLLNSPFSIAIGDLNQDGNSDLVVANYAITSVTVLLGNGVGSFAGAGDFEVGTFPRQVAIADFNRDGTPDLVTANEGSNNVSILRNTCLGILPRVGHFPARTISGSFTLTVPAGFAWEAMSDVDWVTVDTPMGVGSAMVSFTLAANPGAVRSGTITVSGQTYTVKQGANFADVTQENIFYDFIGKLSAAGVTTGCGTNGLGIPIYCPAQSVTREQMAAFLLRALGEFNPPTPDSQRFIDVPPENLFYSFIDRMAVRGITTGCNLPQDNQYCPGDNVTREQMAAFIMRALGEFNPPTPDSQRFIDVPPENLFYAFIDRMAVREITVGCNPPQNNQYCPTSFVTRDQMAAFLVRAFGL